MYLIQQQILSVRIIISIILKYLSLSMLRKLLILVVFLAILNSAECKKQTVRLELGKAESNQTLTQEDEFQGHYIINVQKSKIPSGERWFIFLLVEPQKDKIWEETQITLMVKPKGKDDIKLKKICDKDEGVNSCFITNRKLNIDEDTIEATVKCKQACTYKINAEISEKFTLTPNTSLKLDFQKSAYSKVFSLNVGSQKFDELRIILRPIVFLDYPAPIELYANKGRGFVMVPSSNMHDYKGIHLWDDGQGIFLTKSELMENQELRIVVTGPQQNVLELQNTFLMKNTIQTLPKLSPLFDYLREKNEERKYSFTLSQKKQNLYIRLLTFTGSITLSKVFNIDTHKNIDFQEVSSRHGQILYKFTPKQIEAQKLQKLQITIKAQKQSTFLVEQYSEISQVSTLKTDLSVYSELPKGEIDQYAVQIHLPLEQKKQHHKFEISFRDVKGSSKAKFFKCKKQLYADCKLTPKQFDNVNEAKDLVEEITPISKNTEGQYNKNYFKLEVSKFQVQKSYKKIIVFIVVKNTNQTSQIPLEYLIELTNSNQVTLLKEQEVKKDRLDISQRKIYKFSNINQDISQARIHVVEISGRTKFQGTFLDPRKQENAKLLNQSLIIPTHRTIIYKNVKRNSSIYLIATALDFSYYSVSLQLIRGSGTSEPKDPKNYNQLLIAEGISYEFLIQPKGKMVFQGHPKTKQFKLFFTSPLPLDVCMTQIVLNPPFQPNCQVKEKLNDVLTEGLLLQYGDVVNIGVSNKNEKNVTFKIKLVSNVKDPANQSLKQCSQGNLGEITETDSVSIANQFCITYTLLQIEEIQVQINFGGSFKPTAQVQLKINDKQKLQMLSPMKKISKQQLAKDCVKDSKETCKLTIYFNKIEPGRVYVLTQYTNKEIKLMDGLAYSFTGAIQLKKPKNFIYKLVNKVNTTIIVENKMGFYKFYVNIVRLEDYLSGKSSIFPSNQKNDFVSANPFYFLHQVLTITESQIKQKCKSESCLALISVFLDEDMRPNDSQGKFVIEVTQQVRFLKENTPSIGYLQKKSFAFFQYYNLQEKGSILVSVNNQNKHCLNIFMKKGNNERVTQSNSQRQTLKGSQLIFQNATKGTYSITIEATDHCSYSIEVTSSSSKYSRITKGIFSDISLKAGQKYKLVYDNSVNETLKVLSLISSGETMISVKGFKYSEFNDIVNKDSDTIFFDWSGKDVVRVEKTKPKYCVNCFYLIVIEAIKNTQASIVIPTSNVQIPLSVDKFLTDELAKGQSIVYRIYTDSIIKSEIYVQYGKVQMTIKTQNNQTLVKVYETSKERITQKFDTKKQDMEYQIMKFSRVTFKALENSLYSYKVLSSQGQPGFVQPGIPQYLFLQPNKQKCVKGYLLDSSQELLLSYTIQEFQIQHKLHHVFKINEKEVKLENKTAKNEMILELPESYTLKSTQDNPQSNPFEICFTTQLLMSLTFIQSSRVNFLPLDIPIFVKKEVNLTFGSNGKNILQINQCQKKAKFLISSSFNTLQAPKSQIPQFRKKHNIIEFNYFGPVYMHVEVQSGTVLRKQKDDKKGIGMGYDYYRAGGGLRIERVQENLIVTADSIQSIQGVSSKITKIVYTAFIASQKSDLNNAINCEKGKFIKKLVKVSNQQLFKKVSLSFNIKQILKEFEFNPYTVVGIIARVKVETIAKTSQIYRFTYNQQQIPRQILTGQIVIIDPPSGTSYLWYIILLIGILIVGFFIYRRFVKRWYSRRIGLNEVISGNQMQYSGFVST